MSSLSSSESTDVAGPAGFLSGCRSPVRSMSVGPRTPSPVASAGAVASAAAAFITAPVRALFSSIAVVAFLPLPLQSLLFLLSGLIVCPSCLALPIFPTPSLIAWNNLTSWSDYSERNGNKMELFRLRRLGTLVGIFSGLKLLAM